MKPALTPEEWAADGDVGRMQWYIDRDIGVVDARLDNPHDWHALAALCLHGQPFGFTREDVEVVRAAMELVDLEAFPPARIAKLDSLADRIEALLPPEGA